jgi:hypothetical protein
MTDNQLAQPKFQINSQQVIAGSILIGVGGIIALAGAAVAGVALVVAYRDRVRQMDVPPTELARRHWHRVREATNAGLGQWRNGSQPVEVVVSQ